MEMLSMPLLSWMLVDWVIASKHVGSLTSFCKRMKSNLWFKVRSWPGSRRIGNSIGTLIREERVPSVRLFACGYHISPWLFFRGRRWDTYPAHTTTRPLFATIFPSFGGADVICRYNQFHMWKRLLLSCNWEPLKIWRQSLMEWLLHAMQDFII